MAKRSKLGKWIAKVKAGNATVNIHGKTRAAAKRNATRFVKRHMKNIEQGFFEGGIFHPIRGSRDYDLPRAGEGRSRRAGRAKAKRYTKKSRPMH